MPSLSPGWDDEEMAEAMDLVLTRAVPVPGPESSMPCLEQREQKHPGRIEHDLSAHGRGGQLEAEPEHLSFEHWARRMAHGLFEDAWRINDSLGRHWPSAHRLWGRQSIRNADVTVRSLHGLGDAVQILRYAPRLRELVRNLYFEVPAELEPLMPYFAGVDEAAVRNHEDVPRPSAWHVELEMMELPYLFRSSLAQLSSTGRYLVLPDSVLTLHATEMGMASKPRVGVVWAGGDWDPDRWLPLRMLKPLLQNGRFEWWNLQGGSASAEAAGLHMRGGSSLCNGGLVALAGTIANLDLVLTVDTLAAHLAGALGIPTWLMLKREADWRWMLGRDDSPWYPSMRLFRQSRRGDWGEVIAAVGQALEVEGWLKCN